MDPNEKQEQPAAKISADSPPKSQIETPPAPQYPPHIAQMKSPNHKDGCNCRVCNNIRKNAAAGRPPSAVISAARDARRVLREQRRLKVRRTAVEASVATQLKAGVKPSLRMALEASGFKDSHLQTVDTMKGIEAAQSSIDKALLRAGITDDKLASVAAGGLDATRLEAVAVIGGEDPREREEIREPDWNVRHKYLETTLKVKGHLSPDPNAAGIGGLMIVAPTIVNTGHRTNCPCPDCVVAWEGKAREIMRGQNRRNQMALAADTSPELTIDIPSTDASGGSVARDFQVEEAESAGQTDTDADTTAAPDAADGEGWAPEE